MKKTLLFVFAMMALAFNANAQALQLFNGMPIQKMSKDGKILVATDYEHTLVVYDSDKNSYDIVVSDYDAEKDFYSPMVNLGFGRAFDNANRFVGNYDECTPAIYDHGQWIYLPITEDVHQAGRFNAADDITPDGKRICGGIAPAAFGLSNNIMLVPVIWDQQADGTYGMYKVLPHPEKDFTGRVPQYITARAMSEDGKTIIGQVVDYSGFWPLPIVYREDANGEWSYEMIGTDLVYNSEAVWPEWVEQPAEFNPTAYMTDAEKAAYEQAVIEHDAAVDAYWAAMWNGEDPGEYPEDVEPTDYIADPTAYNAAKEAYEQAMDEFYAAQNAFFEALYDPANVYGPNYEFNDVFLSPDGKYYATTVISEGESDPMSWFPSMNVSPIRFNLTDNSYVISENTDAIPTGVLADGSVLLISNASGNERDAALWTLEGEEKSLLSHVESISTEAANEVKENMTFTLSDYDDNWEVVPGEEVTLMGTAISNADGTIFAGYHMNNFYEAGDWMFLGYKLDIAEAVASVEKTVADGAKVASYVVTSVTGMEIYRGNSAADARKAMAKGVNLLTTVMDNGTSATVKVTKK